MFGPDGKSHAAAGARGRSIARDIVLPAGFQIRGGRRCNDPIAHFGATGLQTLGINFAEITLIVGFAGIQKRAIKFLVDGEMRQATRGNDTDPACHRAMRPPPP